MSYSENVREFSGSVGTDKRSINGNGNYNNRRYFARGESLRTVVHDLTENIIAKSALGISSSDKCKDVERILLQI